MLRFAREHRSNAGVGIISEDRGFALPLRHCRSLGCHTVAVCKYATLCIPSALLTAPLASLCHHRMQ